MIRRRPQFHPSKAARVIGAASMLAFVLTVAADPDLDRIEARLIQLERELAVPATILAVAISPTDAVVQINGVTVQHGQPLPFTANQALQLQAGGDKLKPFTATLTPVAEQTRLELALCPATIQEEYLYQPPDKVTTENAGTAEHRTESACPEAIEEQRRMADQACAATYPGATRNPNKTFSMQQPLFATETPFCIVGAACIIRKSETPEKVKRLRDVDNTRCTARAELH
ncbi:MAG: hypothetical protein IT494_06100 [Gammaproteobacteria bacterium]|nr:hypothetical protein [Gammaproteobacteria bacterium]